MCRGIDVFLVRQFLQLTVGCLTTYSAGMITTFPSVLNPAILAPDSDIKATPDQASWITTCLSISGLVGYTFMPTIFEIYGRKASNMITNVAVLSGCITYLVAKDVYALGFARLLQGVSIPGLYVYIIGLSECITPNRRGYFLVLNKISLILGALTCHSVGLVLNWRQISILTALPTCFSMILIMITAESPSFFASRGQFDECTKSFIWYRGTSLQAKKELQDLVEAQKENFIKKQKEKNINILKKTGKMIMTKSFRKSFFIVTLAKLCLDFCGRYFILTYITQILTELTKNHSLSMYLSIVADFITILALLVSYVLIKRFNRRVLLFKFGFCSALLMLVVSLTLVLGNKLNFSIYAKWLTFIIILLHVFVTNAGLVPVVFTLSGEIFSLEHRGIGSFLSGIVFLTCYGFILKFTPMLLDKTGVEGAYFIYGSCLLLLLILLKIILFETKDKTLQQIEDELNGIMRNKTETELLNESKASNNC